jgi:hypothetical protein
VLVGGTPGKDHGIILKRECTIEGKTETECHVNSPGEPAGSITYAVKSVLVYIGTKEEAKKEEGKLGDLLEPEEGTTFVTIEVAGTNCPIFTKEQTKSKAA